MGYRTDGAWFSRPFSTSGQESVFFDIRSLRTEVVSPNEISVTSTDVSFIGQNPGDATVVGAASRDNETPRLPWLVGVLRRPSRSF